MSIITKIKNRSKWLMSYPVYWYYRFSHKVPTVAGIEETIEKIIQVSGSISRYGDGELDIMVGRDIPFQTYDAELAKKMKAILLSDHENFLVGLPDTFNGLSIYTPKARKYYNNYLRANIKHWYRLTKRNTTYYCAGITRPYMDLSDKTKSKRYFDMLKTIWNARRVVIVEGEKSRLGVGNDLFAGCIEIKRILCPATNAFSFYNEIIEKVAEFSHDYMILLALGPTATAMAYDLYQMGYRALDIGHVDIEYEWCRMGVVEKCAVKNKYTNEAEFCGGLEVGDCSDEIYRQQIYAKVGC